MVNIRMTERQNHPGVVYLKVYNLIKYLFSLRDKNLQENMFLEKKMRIGKNKELL